MDESIRVQAINGGKYVEVIFMYRHPGIAESTAGTLLFSAEGYKTFRALLGSGAVAAQGNGITFQLIETNFNR